MKSVFIITIVILVLLNIFLMLQIKKVKAENPQTSEVAVAYSSQDELMTLRNNYFMNLSYDGQELSNLNITDLTGNTKSLYSVIKKNRNTLVCRFSQNHCETCVNSVVSMAKKWVEQNNAVNVVFFAEYENVRIFSNSVSLYGLEKSDVYNVGNIPLPSEEVGYPYFYLLDENYQAMNIFIPNKGYPPLTVEYLNKIRERLHN